MIIENLSILDYFKLKNTIKLTLKEHNKNLNFFNLFNFKKISHNNELIMLLFVEKLDFNTFELKKYILFGKLFFEDEKTYKLKSKNQPLKLITKEKTFSKLINNVKSSNLILNSNIDNMNLYNFEDFNNNCKFEEFDLKLNLKERCKIQNEIFFNKNRIPLKESDIIYECKKENYIPKLAYFIKIDNNYAGYGQILFIDNNYYIANFGILAKYRNKGYGNIFLSFLIKKAQIFGISKIYIKVDGSNDVALHLYKKIGFKYFKELNIYEID